MEEEKLVNSYLKKEKIGDTDFLKLKAGMSKKEVLERLGKPDIIELNYNKAFKFYKEETNYLSDNEGSKGDEWFSDNPDYIDNFFGNVKLDNTFKFIESKKNSLTYYCYDYDPEYANDPMSERGYGEGYQNVYFIDDKVIALTW